MARGSPIRWPAVILDARGWPRPPHFADPGFARLARRLYDAMRLGREDHFYRLVGRPMRRLMAISGSWRVALPAPAARYGTGQRALRRLMAYATAVNVERNRRFIAAQGGIQAFVQEDIVEPAPR